MDLFERMKDVFCDSVEEFSTRVQIVGFNCVGVFGFCKVVMLSTCEVLLDCGKFNMAINGGNLKISRCEIGEIYVLGDIKGVEKICEKCEKSE